MSEDITVTDGTSFSIQSEHVRGEPRWYFIMRRDKESSVFTRDAMIDGSTDKRLVERRLARRAHEWERAHA